jgi:outer membrane protein
MKNKILRTLAVAAIGCAALPAVHAADDHWVVRFGAHVVDPKSDTGRLAGMKSDIDSDVKPSASLEYMFTPNWGVDALAALPFKHEVKLNGQKAATTKHLPPTFGVNYHFMPDAQVSPFVGVGLNYTYFFDSYGRGILKGAKVKIDDSWGAAAHAGLDVKLSDKWIFTADVRWIDIESDVKVNGAKVGKAKVDPWVYGVSFGYRF